MRPGGLGSACEDGTKAVVPFDPVPPTRAAPRVITIPVSDTITERARGISSSDRDAEAQLDHHLEEARHDMQAEGFTWGGVQPGSGPRLREEAEVSSGSFTSWARLQQT